MEISIIRSGRGRKRSKLLGGSISTGERSGREKVIGAQLVEKVELLERERPEDIPSLRVF